MIRKIKDSVKNIFSKKIAIENAIEPALVVLAFLSVIFPVVYFALSQSAIIRESEANPSIGYSAPEKIEQPPAEEDVRKININTSDWKTYANNWYGFRIDYPEDWNVSIVPRVDSSANFEYRYSFRKPEGDKSENFIGFDVVTYSLTRIKSPLNADEIILKNISDGATDGKDCSDIDGHLEENEEFPAEEVSIPSGDECFEEAYFFTLTGESYVYNFVPVASEDLTGEKNIKKKIKEEFPEFSAAAQSFGITKILRPKPKPKITAPKPLAEVKIKNGKRYCAKKNDKPRKSKEHEKKHMDMECCLDPDEIPNPWCTY
ncbi:MAG: hypothetical protein A3J76_01430 [Candidatus Moranbacteria bacterium RBG_13_45_13]|nr:MAG: hypothetical protein A3J76_01430 [Candidatus Moranbacteria bacterium RBG_13_45_13]